MFQPLPQDSNKKTLFFWPENRFSQVPVFMYTNIRTVLLAGLLIGLFYSAGDGQHSYAFARYSQADGRILVTLPLKIWGSGASQALATKWEKWIEKLFNDAAAKDEYRCFPIELDVNVQLSGPANPASGFTPWESYLLAAGDDAQAQNARLQEMHQVLIENGVWEEGWDYWYVPDIFPGAHSYDFQDTAKTGIGDYQSDKWGWVAGNAEPRRVVHEAMHLLGHEDHYHPNGGPNPGWENNIMSELVDTLDERNFQEIIESIKENVEGHHLVACLTIEQTFQVTSYAAEPPCNNDIGKGKLVYSVSGFLPGKGETDRGTDAISLTGFGHGSLTGLHQSALPVGESLLALAYADWTPLSRCPGTEHESIRIINNPFPVEVSGVVEIGAEFHIETLAKEEGCFRSTFGDWCWEDGALTELLLPEIVVPWDAEVGDEFPFVIYWDSGDAHYHEGEGVATVIGKIE
jgi:hypothetical protein